jgi:hypothetical protein
MRTRSISGSGDRGGSEASRDDSRGKRAGWERIEEAKADVPESVCGDVDNPQSFIRKDARIAYTSLCQGYIGREKSDEGRAVNWKRRRHTRLLIHPQLRTQSQPDIRQVSH